jgi:hypothetical protein
MDAISSGSFGRLGNSDLEGVALLHTVLRDKLPQNLLRDSQDCIFLPLVSPGRSAFGAKVKHTLSALEFSDYSFCADLQPCGYFSGCQIHFVSPSPTGAFLSKREKLGWKMGCNGFQAGYLSGDPLGAGISSLKIPSTSLSIQISTSTPPAPCGVCPKSLSA